MTTPTCRFIQLRKISDERGSLTPIEGAKDIPFAIRRIYYLYDLPQKAVRGAHAHRALHQVFIALNGGFDMITRGPDGQETYKLDSPARALYMPPMVWHDLDNFLPGTVCLALASDLYDEADYLRDYDAFLITLGAQKS